MDFVYIISIIIYFMSTNNIVNYLYIGRDIFLYLYSYGVSQLLRKRNFISYCMWILGLCHAPSKQINLALLPFRNQRNLFFTVVISIG